MSEIIYESLQKVTKRKLYFLESENQSDPRVYLESKYMGQEILITGVVKGSDYADARSGLEALEAECKQNEEKIILNITGKIISLKTDLKPDSSYQPFTITLGVYE